MRSVRSVWMIFFVLVSILTGIGCSEFSITPRLDNSSDTQDLSPAHPDPEIMAIALWMSRELAAPQHLYDRIKAELDLIRGKFSDSLPAVKLTFQQPWEPGRLIIGLEEKAYDRFTREEYYEWDLLNGQFNLTDIDPYVPTFRMLKLTFAEGLNPEVLADYYSTLPGVRFAVPNRFMGEIPMLLPASAPDGRILYFFRNAWGDCPSGCLYSEYWVFAVVRGRVVFDGYFADKEMLHNDLRSVFDSTWTLYWQGAQPSIPADFPGFVVNN